MPAYEAMPFHLETERLILRPWAESDAAEFCALLSERGDGTPTVEHIRTAIAKLLDETASTGIALLPVQRRDEGGFIGYCGRSSIGSSRPTGSTSRSSRTSCEARNHPRFGCPYGTGTSSAGSERMPAEVH